MKADPAAALAQSALFDLDERRRARFLFIGSLTFAIAALHGAIGAAALGAREVSALGFLHVALALVAAVATRRGRTELAAWLVTGIVITATFALVLTQGTHSSRLAVLVAAAFFVGLTARPWVAPVYVVLALGIIVFGVALERAGLVPMGDAQWPVQVAALRALVATTVLAVAFRRGFRRLLALRIERARARAEASQALDAARVRLERLVAARAIELEQATRDLAAFMASVSHDLKAPLRHIEGFVSFYLEAGPTDVEDAAALDEVKRASLALSAKVQAIVDTEAVRLRVRTPQTGSKIDT